MYYEGVWGVGELRVKMAESGELIRFNYRVLDPEKAAALNDKNVEPGLPGSSFLSLKWRRSENCARAARRRRA
jgi:hypothetical protein